MGSTSFSDVGKMPPQHQVFISFRGKELRGGFVSFLVPALRIENVNLFIDEAEMRSSDLQDLFKRIEESSVAVVIFSELYTESKWCLNELVKINERMIEGKLKVIPIFYKLTVEDVKTLEGNFGINFRKHQGGLVRIRKWKKALHSITQKFGLSSSEYRTDFDLLNVIVVEVKKLLNHILTEKVDAAKVHEYRKEKQASIKQTKKRLIVPKKNSSFTITRIRKMLFQRSTQMSSSEKEEDDVIVSTKDIIEAEDKWKPEDSAKTIGKLIRFTGEGEEMKEHYQKFEFDGKQYGLEDSVLIIPSVPTRKLYAAIIKDIYKEGKEGYVYLEVQWFYRLEDLDITDDGSCGTRDSRVLFYSFHLEEIFAEYVRNKCTVHFVPSGKQIPSPGPHPDFVVQNVYDFVDKKLLNLTDKDFEKKQRHEIDLLVAKTMSRLGDLLDIDKDQNTGKLTSKRSAPKRRKVLLSELRG